MTVDDFTIPYILIGCYFTAHPFFDEEKLRELTDRIHDDAAAVGNIYYPIAIFAAATVAVFMTVFWPIRIFKLFERKDP